jgi:hypothetical protein
MRAYSLDLREKIVESVKKGIPKLAYFDPYFYYSPRHGLCEF